MRQQTYNNQTAEQEQEWQVRTLLCMADFSYYVKNNRATSQPATQPGIFANAQNKTNLQQFLTQKTIKTKFVM